MEYIAKFLPFLLFLLIGYWAWRDRKVNKKNYAKKTDINNSEIKVTSTLITCPDCKKEISRNAELCPHCGAPNIEITNTKSNNILIIGGVISVLLFIIIIILYNDYCSKNLLSNMC